MSLENWGQMTKAQDDSQTIDEAIAAAIAEHEADPESHMGAGESIENHRSNEIIDHLAGSVLADKLDAQGVFLTASFESLDNFNVVGNVQNFTWPGVILGMDDYSPYKSVLDNIGSNSRDFVDFTKSFVIQFSFFASEEGAGKHYFRFGQITENPSPLLVYGVALELLPTGDLFRWKRVGHDVTVSIPTVTRAEYHTVRILFDVELDTLYLIIDGVNVASMPNAYPASNTNGNNFMFFLDNTTADGYGDRSVMELQYFTINCR